MRIGIDARFFGAKDKGFGRYVENLIKELENLSPPEDENHFFVFLKKDRWEDYQPRAQNFQKVLADYRWYGIKEQILFSLQLRKYNLNLMHFTHFNVPILYRKKFVVTIHDLTLRYFPTFKKSFWSFLIYPMKNLAYRIVFKYAVKNSEKIIAVSQFTKKDILKHYPVNPDKIKVIYEGIN